MLELIEIYWHGLAFGIGMKTNLQRKPQNQDEFVDEKQKMKRRNLLGLRDEIHRRSFDSKILLSIDRATFSIKTCNLWVRNNDRCKIFGAVRIQIY